MYIIFLSVVCTKLRLPDAFDASYYVSLRWGHRNQLVIKSSVINLLEPTLHGGRTVSSNQPLLTRKL